MGLFDSTLEMARNVPGLGRVVNGAESAYHTGAAAADLWNGDTEGAREHGSEALVSGAGLVGGSTGRRAASRFMERSEDGVTGEERDNAVSELEADSGMLGAVPVLGEVMNMAQARYHSRAAVYDGIHGDRDGAIAHGAQAAYSTLGSIPVVSEIMGGADVAFAGAAGEVRRHVSEQGGDASQVPTGIADLAASSAVMMTNAAFGADDSNLIAPGDRPTGTRGGEIRAGMDELGAPGEHANALGVTDFVAEQLGADVDGPTSGARGPGGEPTSWAQEAGDELNQYVGADTVGRAIGQRIRQVRTSDTVRDLGERARRGLGGGFNPVPGGDTIERARRELFGWMAD